MIAAVEAREKRSPEQSAQELFQPQNAPENHPSLMTFLKIKR